MWSIIAASVVLLPLPVVPVTSTRPRSSSRDALEDRRQAELVDRADPRRDDAQDDADGAALLEDVAAEAAEARRRCRRGRLPARAGTSRWCSGVKSTLGHRLGVGAVEPLLFRGDDAACR